MKLYVENSTYEIDFSDDDEERIISLIYDPSNKLYCSLVNVEEFSDECCAENPYCQTTISQCSTMKCRDCLLTYHTFCVGGNDEVCGCYQQTLLISKYV